MKKGKFCLVYSLSLFLFYFFSVEMIWKKGAFWDSIIWTEHYVSCVLVFGVSSVAVAWVHTRNTYNITAKGEWDCEPYSSHAGLWESIWTWIFGSFVFFLLPLFAFNVVFHPFDTNWLMTMAYNTFCLFPSFLYIRWRLVMSLSLSLSSVSSL